MKSLESWINDEVKQAELYCSMELIDEKSKPAVNENWLNAFWKQLMRFLAPPSEPIVSQQVDEAGHVWWNVYDPLSGQLTWFDTEYEVLEWLDRYPRN